MCLTWVVLLRPWTLTPPSALVGAVKVTPGHDHADFLLAQRHSLPRLSVIGGDGRLTAACGAWLQVCPHLEETSCDRLTAPLVS